MLAKTFFGSLMALGLVWSQLAPSSSIQSESEIVSACPKDAIVANAHGVLCFFSRSPDGNSIETIVRDGSSENKHSIDVGGRLKNIVGITATAQSHYIAIGVECFDTRRDEYEYRFLFNRGTPSGTYSTEWICSPVVHREPVPGRLNVMTVTILEGDTVAITLQRLVRKNGPSTHGDIETRTIVNPCPADNDQINAKITDRYEGKLTYIGKLSVGRPDRTNEKP